MNKEAIIKRARILKKIKEIGHLIMVAVIFGIVFKLMGL